MDWPVKSASSLISSRSIGEVEIEHLLIGAGIGIQILLSPVLRQVGHKTMVPVSFGDFSTLAFWVRLLRW